MIKILIFISYCIFAVAVAKNAILGDLRLTIAYCPTLTTGAGAIVTVDPQTGTWTIDSTFKWPADIFGCPILVVLIIKY